MKLVWGADKIAEATAQEVVLIQGGIAEGPFYWIMDDHGNRLALTWNKKHAERVADALDVLEDVERQMK